MGLGKRSKRFAAVIDDLKFTCTATAPSCALSN
jgi:peroxiredoxin